MHRETIEIAKQLCRENRKHQTQSERMLWQAIRGRQLLGAKFYRQYPFFFHDISGKESFYIADLYCHEYGLVIELDGRSHYYQHEYDEQRTSVLEGFGVRVMRFSNLEVEENIEGVLKKMEDFLQSGTPSLLKRRGEGMSSDCQTMNELA